MSGNAQLTGSAVRSGRVPAALSAISERSASLGEALERLRERLSPALSTFPSGARADNEKRPAESAPLVEELLQHKDSLDGFVSFVEDLIERIEV